MVKKKRRILEPKKMGGASWERKEEDKEREKRRREIPKHSSIFGVSSERGKNLRGSGLFTKKKISPATADGRERESQGVGGIRFCFHSSISILPKSRRHTRAREGKSTPTNGGREERY